MKTMIVYSSLTGNTKKVAEAINEVFDGEASLFPVEAAPAAEAYDLVAVGFWVDKGTADRKTQEYLKTIHGKKVALFATLGAYPDSEHAAQSLTNAAAFLSEGNQLAGKFICQGKIDPRLIEQLKQMPENHPHTMTPERLERYREAAKHPDDKDLQAARDAFSEIKNKVRLQLAAQEGKGEVFCGKPD